jgi:serine/threonine protein kinase
LNEQLTIKNEENQILNSLFGFPFFVLFLTLEAKDLIRQMLVYDPEQRISCKMIMQHRWLTMGKKDCPNLDRFQVPDTINISSHF